MGVRTQGAGQKVWQGFQALVSEEGLLLSVSMVLRPLLEVKGIIVIAQ